MRENAEEISTNAQQRDDHSPISWRYDLESRFDPSQTPVAASENPISPCTRLTFRPSGIGGFLSYLRTLLFRHARRSRSASPSQRCRSRQRGASVLRGVLGIVIYPSERVWTLSSIQVGGRPLEKLPSNQAWTCPNHRRISETVIPQEQPRHRAHSREEMHVRFAARPHFRRKADIQCSMPTARHGVFWARSTPFRGRLEYQTETMPVRHPSCRLM